MDTNALYKTNGFKHINILAATEVWTGSSKSGSYVNDLQAQMFSLFVHDRFALVKANTVSSEKSLQFLLHSRNHHQNQQRCWFSRSLVSSWTLRMLHL